MQIRTTTRTAAPRRRSVQALCLTVAALHGADLYADNLWDLSLADLGSIRVTSIASGTQTPLDKAAAIATVITAEDIEAIGATDIDQVLETVPGLHVGRSDQSFNPNYYFRGITSTYNPQTLMLINGVPITSMFVGSRGQVWGGMPVKSIARIEVIRGPGSALYGADAFAGVINIITKSANELRGLNAGARVGSFNTRSGWMQYGGTRDGIDLAFSLEAETTDGWKETIDSDRQTVLDSFTGSKASLAPGSVNTMKKLVEARLDIANNHHRLRTGYQARFNVGSGPGYFEALDPNSRAEGERFNLDYTYSAKDLSPHWELEQRVSFYRGTQVIKKDIWLLPPGAKLVYPDPVDPVNNPPIVFNYPDGLIGNPGNKEENARFDFNTLFKGLDDHYIRLGAGFYWGDMFEVTETKNFNPDTSPRGGIVDVSDTAETYLPEKDRTSSYLYAQDEWKLTPKWQMTSGVRYDHYSDFGNTVNPRLALVWAAQNNMTVKWLYGRAFRAPTLAELFVTSNPINLGNPNLKPETIDTYEVALSHQVMQNLSYTANIYNYQIHDFITFVPDGTGRIQAQNVGHRKGQGFEVEADYTPNFSLRFLVNYSYQQSKDQNSGQDVGGAPNQEIYVRNEWLFLPSWHLDTQVTWVGPQKRAAGDTRAASDAYTTVDLTLRKREAWKSLDLALSVRNLLDEDVREPSPGPSATLPVPPILHDFPMAGRSAYLEATYKF
ncbi:iron complex outermembrane receptor protein [Fluviicoccus keumensis]|uniref:Iron complex outermembrane receptor protein n=1 Tax=Fluviicoccus keumensis TaxID=1435465 RepID=A0A4V2G3U4_9GAMM|nr:TonB-dependent receptor [Fluviicoccus keumensis]RZU38356.1 iron complex outermembrane receptor protein [Fluviicoccus keumensis]